MDQKILDTLKRYKQTLLKEDGFEIVAVFGSFARDDVSNNSDIDILYNINNKFLKKYGGFQAFYKINKIREKLQKELNREIDLATIDNSSDTFKKFALKDVIYVQ